ncbi:MAG: hypothetical protein II832_11040 [Synergistaceae bacterium]|nr:hypothetical protein [Synergistaceae bacterium]
MLNMKFSVAELRRIDRITDERLRAYELRKLIWRAMVSTELAGQASSFK